MDPAGNNLSQHRRRQRLFEALSLVVGLGALGVLSTFFGLSEVKAALSRLSPVHLGIYLALGATVRLGYGLRWFLVARALGPVPAWRRFVAARLAGDAVGALVPSGSLGGDPVRVLLLHGHGVGGATAGAGVAFDRTLELMTNTTSGVVYVTLFSFAHSRQAAGETWWILGTLLILLAALALPLLMMRFGIHPVSSAAPVRWLAERLRWQRGVAWVRRVEDGLIDVLRRRPWLFLWGLLGSLLIEALVVLEYRFLLAAFGLDLGWTTVMMMLLAVGLVRVVPVPAGLGALEVGQVTLMRAIRNRADLGFLAGVVMRLHETLWLGIGLAALSLQGFSLARLRRATSLAVDDLPPGSRGP